MPARPLHSVVSPFGPVADSRLVWLDASKVPTLVAGFEDHFRFVESIGHYGSAGGVFEAAAAASAPVQVVDLNRTGLHFSGNQFLVSSLSPSAWVALHNGSTKVTYQWRGRIMSLAATQTIVSTQAGSDSDIGVSLEVLTSGAVRFRIGDGTTSTVVDSSAGAVAADTMATITVRFSTTGPLKVQIMVGSSVVGTEVNLAVTPSASSPAATLHLGAQSTPMRHLDGFTGELLIYTRWLLDHEVDANRTYFARWDFELTLAHLNNAVLLARFGVTSHWKSNGSALIDVAGNYTPTEVGSPTHLTSAAFNDLPVCRFNGSNQYATVDALSSVLGVTDGPFSLVAALKLNAAGGSQHTLFGFGRSGSTNDYHMVGALTTPTWFQRRYDGVSIDTHSAGTPTTSPAVFGSTYRLNTSGVDVSTLYLGDQVLDADATFNAGTFTGTDQVTIGAERINGGVVTHLNADLGSLLLLTRGLNLGEYRLLQGALTRGYFG